MKTFMIAAVLALAGLTVKAQDDAVLMTIGDNEVTVQEFLAIYNKNNNSTLVDKKTMEEYLDLFINFKLKVAEAESLGMDTAGAFKRELTGYRNQLAQPYLVDREYNEALVKEAYDRMQEDVEAYHILLKMEPDASPKDTLAAVKKLKAIAAGIKTLDDFKAAVVKYSDDPSAAQNVGYLGYFTAFSMVYPFETVAYNTKPGTVSKPVRTRFGYHLIFVNDKRPARGEVKVAHIMTKASADATEEEKAAAKQKIDEIYAQLEEGADFAALARQYSEDHGTADKGGDLPWFGTGRMVGAFEDAAFALENNGDYSKPVQTSYGWHIIMREDYKPVADFETMKHDLKKRIERDSRGQQSRDVLLAKLKKEYTVASDKKARAEVEGIITEKYLESAWERRDPKRPDAVVLTITDKTYGDQSMQWTEKDYLVYLIRNQRQVPAGTSLKSVLGERWDDFVNQSLIAFEEANLENKYPEFKALMQEYHDGILLFDLMDEKVWSKAVKDTAGLEAYYAAHKADFMWGDRVKASIYTAANEKIAAKARKLAAKREKKGYTDEELIAKVAEDAALDLTIKSGTYSKGDNAIIDGISWEPGISDNMAQDGKILFAQVYEVLPPQPKELSEARGLVTSAYQSQLEKEWIEELRSKFSFTVNDELFKSLEN